MAKHIFVTGGVVSSLGKGITAASLGHLLKARGYKVTMQKMDPYLNVDPGTMSPFQAWRGLRYRRRPRRRPRLGPLRALHRRVPFARVQLHAGFHLPDAYRARAPRRLPRRHRAGHPACDRGYQGTICAALASPVERRHRHLRDRRHDRRHRVPAVHRSCHASSRKRRSPGDVLFVHVTLVPYIAASPRGEDQADAALREGAAFHRRAARLHRVPLRPRDHRRGAREDRAVLRRGRPTDVLACVNSPSIYEVPLALDEQGFDVKVLDKLGLEVRRDRPDAAWRAFLEAADNCAGPGQHRGRGQVRLACPDAYLSVIEALVARGRRTRDATWKCTLSTARSSPTTTPRRRSAAMDGILVPGGFGQPAPSRARSPQRATPAMHKRSVPRHLPGAAGGGHARSPAMLPAMPGATSARSSPTQAEHPVIDLYARAGGRRGQGRHHAPGRTTPARCRPALARARGATASPSSTSAIAIATR